MTRLLHVLLRTTFWILQLFAVARVPEAEGAA